MKTHIRLFFSGSFLDYLGYSIFVYTVYFLYLMPIELVLISSIGIFYRRLIKESLN